MSSEVDVAYVRQFESNVQLLAQQNKSKLRPTVIESQMEGELKATEQVGVVDMAQITARHQDTPLTDTPHRRRWLQMSDYVLADMVDRPDQIRAKIDLAGAYMKAQAAGLARRIDRTIIACLDATSLTGKTATGSATLASTQIIQATGTDAANSSGGTSYDLTIPKLRRAMTILGNAGALEYDDAPVTFVGTYRQRQSLLMSLVVGSRDYNDFRAFEAGDVRAFMGINFIWLPSTMLTVASNIRDCFMYQQFGVECAIGLMEASVDKRPDKMNNVQIMARLSIGATRLEEERVVKIQCDETATTVPASVA